MAQPEIYHVTKNRPKVYSSDRKIYFLYCEPLPGRGFLSEGVHPVVPVISTSWIYPPMFIPPIDPDYIYYKAAIYNLITLCLNGILSCVDFMDVTMGDIPKLGIRFPHRLMLLWCKLQVT